jgi:thiamine biosynthesis lipoprotein
VSPKAEAVQRDPRTGRPAFTGIVQATALAPTGLEAEVRANAARLAGPANCARYLPHGGAVLRDDGGSRCWAEASGYYA